MTSHQLKLASDHAGASHQFQLVSNFGFAHVTECMHRALEITMHVQIGCEQLPANLHLPIQQRISREVI